MTAATEEPAEIESRVFDVHVSGAELRLGTMVGARLDAHLVNAYLPLRALLRGRAGELSVERVHGNIVVPYTELGRVSPVPGLRLDFRDGRLIVSAAVPLLGISALARVSGEAVVWVGDRGGVRLRVRDIALAGMSVPAIVLNRIVPAIGFPIPLPPLPFGLRIERLTPIQDGLQVSGSANEVVFRRRADPE